MKIVVLGPKDLLSELLSNYSEENGIVNPVETAGEFLFHPDADAYFDLGFENTAERKQLLNKLLPKPVFINSVIQTLAETGDSFIRINGWPTFLKRSIVEASANDTFKAKAGQIIASLNKTIDWIPDVGGFISARVISMVINEAYFALQESVSTKEEIDIAMKLGTNYPYGPFEWSEKIGLKNIHDLLASLGKTSKRYQPALLLKKEAAQ